MSDKDAIVAARVEAGRRLFARPWQFSSSAPDISALPLPAGIEVAFAGRSNVGKSSLINALVGQKALARTSNTPGRTQELVFFTVDGQLTLVDMPGYGFAKAPKALIASWTRLIFEFLRGRQILRRVYVLIDSRHGLMEPDKTALDLLDKAAVSYQIVLTKADKVKAADLPSLVEKVGKGISKRPAAHPEILTTSAETGAGIAELRAEIAALL